MPGEVLPSTLGRYEIRSIIGRGMMGVVYEAVDPALGRTVALKTIQLGFGISDHERRVFEERFLTEARLAAGLNHPAIVVVHDVGWDDESGTPFMALEYLKGVTLADRLEEGRPLDWRESLRIIARIADALHVAHQEGVVHRDVKPANIMLLPSGEPKIMDFGIAKAPASQLTAAGDVFGTPSYMSPEQAKGEVVDGRSDIFSLGTILYQMLTGQRAFDAPNVPAILGRVTNDPPLPPLQLVPSLPPEVEGILGRAMAKSPAQRYADGRELAEDIEDVLEGRRLRERPGLAEALTGAGTGAPRRSADAERVAARIGDATASLVDHTARVDAGTGGLDWSGGSPERTATAEAPSAVRPPPPRSPLAPGLALAGMLVVAAVSGGVAVSLTRGSEAGQAQAAEPSAADTGSGVAAQEDAAPEPPPDGAVASDEPVGVSQPPTAASPRSAPEPGSASGSGGSDATTAPDGDSGWVSHQAQPAATDGGAATRTARPPAPTPAPGPPPARILLRVQHSLERGELRVSAPDGSLVFRHRLRGEEGKTLGVFTTHKGGLERTIEVPPGTYFVRVEAIENREDRKAGLLRGTFRSGETRVLEVKVGGHMELRWR